MFSKMKINRIINMEGRFDPCFLPPYLPEGETEMLRNKVIRRASRRSNTVTQGYW
jgi:hypothetical protein